ncbi:pilus assembly protein [Methylobacterium sp. E-041]|uniref:TadE/TadG family type IV pilus assembly protein n=1 Tax=Methylobacterium sp. J-092 TaxID=2836667 RepID=UPI001FBAD023|nr:TadE/TadG family type IV pilus assembly protein [Methylobacterium sp. J-092]MCJ2109585.1 pilus assembly protein [Methylobacterium sp. E-041]
MNARPTREPPPLSPGMVVDAIRHPRHRQRKAGPALRRFPAARDGASAVEFALVAMPFIALLAMVLQTALLIWASRDLDDALQRAGRTIYTGEFQTSNAGQSDAGTLLAAMKTAICGTTASRVVTVFDCDTLKLDVALGSSFAGSTIPTPLDTKTRDWSKGFGSNYACAQPGSIVVVTAAVKQRVAFGFLYASLPSFGDGSRLLQSTAVFRTEPYDTSSSKSC